MMLSWKSKQNKIGKTKPPIYDCMRMTYVRVGTDKTLNVMF